MTTDEPGNVRSSDILGTETAPLIYFDGVTAFGVSMGTIQIELAANVILPRKEGGTTTLIRTTACLRCNSTAAADLAQAIEKALEMAKNQAAEIAAKFEGHLN
jgi:hypothetical protein